MQQHFVIERLVDPRAHDILDLRKVHDHAEAVELGRFERNDGPAVVAVQVPAFAVVVQQPVAVAKADFAGHTVHIGASW